MSNETVKAANAAALTQIQVQNQIGHGQAMDAIHEADSIRQRTEIQRLKATAPAPPSGGQGSSSYYAEKKLRDANELLRSKEEAIKVLSSQLAEKDAHIKEWTHISDGFKRLSRKYGASLNVSDEQRQRDFDAEIVNGANDRPEFEGTVALERAKGRLATKPD
jgi:hypothetical protein